MPNEPGGHVVPLAEVVHGGGGCVQCCLMAEGDVRPCGNSILEVA